MDTKVYENFAIIWTMEELQLSDRDIYGSGAPDTYANLPEDDGSYIKSEPKKEENPFAAEWTAIQNGGMKEQPLQYAAAGDASWDEAERSPALRSPEAENRMPVNGADAGLTAGSPEAEGGMSVNRTNAGPASGGPGTEGGMSVNGANVGPMAVQVMVNGAPVRLTGKSGYIFVDVFDYINFDLSVPQGSGIVTELNGRNAQYMEPIRSGDVIKIYWKD